MAQIRNMMGTRGQPFEEAAQRRSSLAGIAQTFNKSYKPTVDIKLEDVQQGDFVPSYTTLDKIQGTVSITAPVDTPFDAIHITFQGSVRAYVEKVASSAPINPRMQAIHNFLRLVQPIDEGQLPPGRVAKAGETYNFPFTFVVPERLLPQSCTHAKDSPEIMDAHLALPPTLGDPMMAPDGKMIDDMTPDMAVISYALRVIMTRKAATGKNSIIVDSVKKLRVMPAVEEAPPLPVNPRHEESDYVLLKSKSVKKGMFKGKLGVLTAEAAQPKSLRLPHLRSESTCPVTTLVVLNLRFDPADSSCKPPRLGQLWNRLKVSTFFGCAPMRDFPRKSSAYLNDHLHGLYTDTISLSSRNVESAQWTEHKNELTRKDSAISISDSSSSPTSPEAGTVFYTSQIVAPVDLPQGCRTFVPSFHACLVSRVYILEFTLSAHSGGSTVSSTHLHLKLPLQISMEADPDARPTISAEEAAAIAARELNYDFIPRSVAPPNPEYIEHLELGAEPRRRSEADLPSPDYEEREEYNQLGDRPLFGSVSGVSGEPQARTEREPPPMYSTFGNIGVGASLGMGRPRW